MDVVTGAGLLLTAAALGLTHGIEPDHVAGIVALTHEAKEPRLSALVGAWFAIGHVVLVVVWMVAANQLRGISTLSRHLEAFGLLFVGIALSVLSLYLGVTGLRKLVHKHTHVHGTETHSHYHVHFPLQVRLFADRDETSDLHTHEHSALEYAKISVVGAAFTLSPPVSMIAFISVVMAQSDVALLTWCVIAYAGAIVGTMAILGGGAGTLSRLLEERGEHLHAMSQIVASVLIFAFAVRLLAGVPLGFFA